VLASRSVLRRRAGFALVQARGDHRVGARAREGRGPEVRVPQLPGQTVPRGGSPDARGDAC